MNHHERMTEMFAAIDADGRRYVLAVLRNEYERVQQAQRPTLRVVEAIPTAACAAGSASSARTASPSEIALLANYDAMDDNGREYLAGYSKHLQKRFPRQRPALTLVEGGQGRPGRAFTTSGKTNMERTSDGK